jgi:hypothetical protein
VRRFRGTPIKREAIEKIAVIFGPTSAAAQALKDADARKGPVDFIDTGSSIVVVKHPTEPSP